MSTNSHKMTMTRTMKTTTEILQVTRNMFTCRKNKPQRIESRAVERKIPSSSPNFAHCAGNVFAEKRPKLTGISTLVLNRIAALRRDVTWSSMVHTTKPVTSAGCMAKWAF
uniref:(northern house mosquito) hypothetical protein n=1 Tax=Culex pipiens TaxID=7175 RepID=A0A8D8H455_CULPI